MGEDRCAIMVQISEECWEVDTEGSWLTSLHICVHLSAHIPFGFTLKYVCIIRDLHATYDMCACYVHMLTDIWNMLTGCVNMCVSECVCIHSLPPSPCVNHVWAGVSLLTISWSSAYLLACLEVLVQKIESTLWECILFFFSLLQNMHLTCNKIPYKRR